MESQTQTTCYMECALKRAQQFIKTWHVEACDRRKSVWCRGAWQALRCHPSHARPRREVLAIHSTMESWTVEHVSHSHQLQTFIINVGTMVSVHFWCSRNKKATINLPFHACAVTAICVRCSHPLPKLLKVFFLWQSFWPVISEFLPLLRQPIMNFSFSLLPGTNVKIMGLFMVPTQ